MISTVRRTVVVAVAGALVLIVAVYFSVLKPETKRLASARQAHVAATAQAEQLRVEVASLQRLKSTVAQQQGVLQVLQGAVPAGPQLDRALNELGDVAAQSGVTISAISPTAQSTSAAPTAAGATASPAAAAATGSPQIGITMTATGTYDHVIAFLTGLAQTQRLIVLDHVTLSGTPTVSAQLQGRLFYTSGA